MALWRESVGQAGRWLAHTLGKREYMGKTAPAFFSACYELRSRLVHGHMPRPSRDDVDVTAANLELFVGHLLSGPLVDSVAD